MSWNYRLVEHTPKDYPDEKYVAIHEVYYDEYGNIKSWSVDSVHIYAENVKDFKWVLSKLQEASDKPLLKVVNGDMVEMK